MVPPPCFDPLKIGSALEATITDAFTGIGTF